MNKPKCNLCGNEDLFIIEGRVHIDGYGNYVTEEWDYEHGSYLRCGKCVQSIGDDNIPDGLVVKGGPLDKYKVKDLNANAHYTE